jgi:hypothetical protein
VVELYLLILEKGVLLKTEIPIKAINKMGIYCSEVGETTFLDISWEIGKEGMTLSVFKTDKVECLSLKDGGGFDEVVWSWLLY